MTADDSDSQQKEKAKQKEKDAKSYHCLEIWTIPLELYAIESEEEREIEIRKLIRANEDGPFPPNSLTSEAPISFVDEMIVIVSLTVVLGGPLAWVFSMVAVLAFGSFQQCVAAIATSLVLAYHPLPTNLAFSKKYIMTSRWTIALYHYFSYRFVWIGLSHDKIRDAAPWIGAAPPHGVMPFANLLSVPGVNTVRQLDFVGAPASVVMHTPFLRYLTLMPSTPASSKNIHKATSKGLSVGLVPDGIAGIFCQDAHKEVVALKHRKGIARHALKYGTNVLPAYSFGNTSAFSSWWDSYGILEHLSRKCQVGIFLYWGRFGLPIPRRCQVTLVCNDPIIVEKVKGGQPTEKQIDELHEKILSGIRECFELHKDSLGWGDKELVFV